MSSGVFVSCNLQIVEDGEHCLYLFCFWTVMEPKKMSYLFLLCANQTNKANCVWISFSSASTHGCLPGRGHRTETRSPRSLDPATSRDNTPHHPLKTEHRKRQFNELICDTAEEESDERNVNLQHSRFIKMSEPWSSWWSRPALSRCPASSVSSPASGCGAGAFRWTSLAPRSGPVSAKKLNQKRREENGKVD